MEKNVEKDVRSLQIVDLPYEVLTLIFSRLAVNDILNVTLTCKKFRGVVAHNHAIWRQKCSETFSVASHKKYQRKCSESNPYQQCRISSNWRRGYFKEMLLAQSQIKYMPWLSLQSEYLLLSTGNALACYPRDKNRCMIKQKYLWKLFTPTVQRRGIRTNDISRFVVKDDVIVCGNRDGCVAVYDLQGGCVVPSIPIFREHIRDCHKGGAVEVSGVECLKSRQNLHVVSCSADDTVVKFWRKEYNGCEQSDESRFQCVREVNAGIDGVKCMQLGSHDNLLAIGLNNNTRIMLIDIETGRLTYNANEYFNLLDCVRDIQWIDTNVIAYVRYEGFLSAFDHRINRVVYNNYDMLGSSFYSLDTDGAHAVVTGTSHFSRCVLYDLRAKHSFVQMFYTQKCSSPVYSVGFDANMLAAAAERAVGVLNFNINTSGVRMRDYGSMIRNGQC